MEYILIADSGSTKCEWAILSEDGKKIKIKTQGISPYFLNIEQIEQILRTELVPSLNKYIQNIKAIYFYGTGLSNQNNIQIISKCFKAVFPFTKKIKIETDIMGACRALACKEKAIVCILGTGSNLAVYNGKNIIHRSPGLGYVLGDEGSGAYIGKIILQHYLYNIFDNDLKIKFETQFKLDKNSILENVYKGKYPNRFLASLSIFIAQNRGHFMIENILEDSLHAFFAHHILPLQNYHKLPIHFTGGISFGYKDVLRKICNEQNLILGRVLKSPIDYLIKYHLLEFNPMP